MLKCTSPVGERIEIYLMLGHNEIELWLIEHVLENQLFF